MSVTFELPYPAETPEDLRLNLSNANARMILGLLGYGYDHPEEVDELVGTLEADMLEARCLLTLGFMPVENKGIPAIETGGPGTGSARILECGVAEGYVEDRIERLRKLAEFARSKGEAVQFC